MSMIQGAIGTQEFTSNAQDSNMGTSFQGCHVLRVFLNEAMLGI